MARASSDRQIRSNPVLLRSPNPKIPSVRFALANFAGGIFAFQARAAKIAPPMQLRQPCLGGFGHGFVKALAYMGAAG
jgi:hypothetical protein